MRVAVLSHTYVEPENRKKLTALVRHGVDVTLFAPAEWTDGTLTRQWVVRGETQDGVRIVPVPVTRLRASPAAAWWHLAPLVERLRSGNFDLLHLEEEPWSFAAVNSVRLARRFHVPSALFTWQNLAHHPGRPLSTLRRWTLARTDGWIAGNRAAADLLRRIDPHKPVTVLPQLGVDLPDDVVQTGSRGTLRIGYVGRLIAAKGVDDLLEALARMPEGGGRREGGGGGGGSWSLVVLGGGPESEALAARAVSLGIHSRVDFRGPVPHSTVGDVWREMDVLVLPSRTTPQWAEQFGHVIIEAMAHGIAVVGSSSGAIPEVIGTAGVVFPEGDAAALAVALTKLVSDPAELAALKKSARKRAGDFTHDNVAENLLAFWQTLIGERAGVG